MAITNGYATLAELKNLLQITVATFDADLERAVETASRAIDDYTGRFFFDTGAVAARVYRPATATVATIDDFHGPSPVVETDEDDDGVFETTWAESDFIVEPLNPEAGEPQRKLIAVDTRLFPFGRRPTLRVSARFGWPAIPTVVSQTALLLAAELWKRKDAPFGVAGFDELGVVRVGASDLRVLQRVDPFRTLESVG